MAHLPYTIRFISCYGPPFVRMAGNSTLIAADKHAVAAPLPPQKRREIGRPRPLPLGGG